MGRIVIQGWGIAVPVDKKPEKLPEAGSPLNVTIPFMSYFAIMSMVLPLAIGIQMSTGKCLGRGTTVISLRR